MKTTNKEFDVLIVFKNILYKKKQLLIWGCCGLCVGLIIAFSLPKQYTSSALVVPETKNSQTAIGTLSGLAGAMGLSASTMSKGGIDENLYPEILKSSPFLAEFTNINVNYDNKQISLFQYLTSEQKAPWWSYIINAPSRFLTLFKKIDQAENNNTILPVHTPSHKQLQYENALANSISFIIEKKTGTLLLNVKMQDPIIATTIADSVIVKLQQYMTKYHTTKARVDLEQNTELYSKAKEKYYAIDTEYAQTLDKNQNLTSAAAKVKLSRLENERDLAFSIYQQLASQVEMNRIKLQEDTPIVTIIEPVRVPLTTSSPNKKLIIIICVLLGIFAKTSIIVVQELLKRQTNN